MGASTVDHTALPSLPQQDLNFYRLDNVPGCRIPQAATGWINHVYSYFNPLMGSSGSSQMGREAGGMELNSLHEDDFDNSLKENWIDSREGHEEEERRRRKKKKKEEAEIKKRECF